MVNRTLIDNTWLRFLLLLLGWGVIGTLFTVQSYIYRINVGQHITWWGIYPSEVFYFLFWGFCTPLVLKLSGRYRVNKSNWATNLPLQIVIGIVFAVCQRIVNEYILQNLKATAEYPFSWERLTQNVIGFSDYGFFIYLIIVFVDHAIVYYKELMQEQLHAARLKEELTTAQLHALKMQIQPHFLFNSLNTVSVLIQEEPKKAEQTLLMISDLLRLTLQRAENIAISLKEELRYVELYLNIEQVRFGDRLKVVIHSENGTLEAQVPPLILQPLVENAIKHGISQKRGEGVVEVFCERKNDSLLIRVNDNGNGFTTMNNSSEGGIGLTNTTSRLKALFGDNANLVITDGNNGGTSVELKMPFKTENSR